jgi:hypothetical protein
VFLRKSYLVHLRNSPIGEVIDTAISGLRELS